MKIISKPSPNFGTRRNNLSVKMIVIHYTDMKTAQDALNRMCDKKAEASAHYMIDLDGTIYQLVEEEKRAWHAGVSFWDGETDVNSISIGIELVNKGHSNGYHPFPQEQMQSLIKLCKDIKTRYEIPAENIVGHSDVAPDRKQDPGHLFDWEMLAKNGINNFHAKKINTFNTL
jgi:N-acetylmuramoyl-L-alanine amidase